MTIEQLQIKIKERIGWEPVILSIFETGSHLFCQNSSDLDYTVIIQNGSKSAYCRIYDKENNIDYFIESEDIRDRKLHFESINNSTRYILDELLKPTTTIYGDNTSRLDLFNNIEQYKAMLKHELEHSCLHPNVEWENSDLYCNKQFWWAILGLWLIENNSYEITNELKSIIQTCHDGTLDKSWETWVKKRLDM